MLFIGSVAICSSLTYRFTSPSYGLAFLLGMLAVWILVKGKGRDVQDKALFSEISEKLPVSPGDAVREVLDRVRRLHGFLHACSAVRHGADRIPGRILRLAPQADGPAAGGSPPSGSASLQE